MLPVLIYEPNTELREHLLNMLDRLSPSLLAQVKISISTGSFDSMKRAIEAEAGICLAVLGIDHSLDNSCDQCTRLGQLAMQHNRDNYTLFLLHEPDDLGLLLQNCMRPAGILISPFKDNQILNAFERILNDYSVLNGPENTNDALLIINDTSTYRIPYHQILYLEALNKKLNICTNRQCITIRKALSSLIEELPPQFVRCHRAYVVNSDFIGKVSFSEMTIQLQNDEVLPISRSQRDAIRQLIDRGKAHEH